MTTDARVAANQAVRSFVEARSRVWTALADVASGRRDQQVLDELSDAVVALGPVAGGLEGDLGRLGPAGLRRGEAADALAGPLAERLTALAADVAREADAWRGGDVDAALELRRGHHDRLAGDDGRALLQAARSIASDDPEGPDGALGSLVARWVALDAGRPQVTGATHRA